MINYRDTVESWINKIDKRLSEKPDAEMDKKLAKDIVSVFSDEIEGIKRGLDRYRSRVYFGGSAPIDIDDRGDLAKLKGKLEIHLAKHVEQLPGDIRDDRGTASMPSIHFEANPQVNVTSHSVASISQEISLTTVHELIDSDGGLSDEEKAYLTSLLEEAEKEAAKKNSGAFSRIGAKIMEGVENATPGVVSGAIGYLASLAAQHFTS